MIGTIPMMDIFSLWKFKICHFIQSKSAPAIRYRDYRRLDIDVIVAQKGVVVGKEGGIRVPFIVGGGRQKREGNHAVGCSLLLFCISVQIHKYTKNINVQIHKCTNAQIHKTMLCLWGPVYGSRCLYLTTYKNFVKLCWCDSGWWWYQLNTS